MPNFFIIDAGQKHGPFNDQQLKALAAKGRITPTTPLETEGGHKGLAGQVNGLKFNVSSPTPVATPRPAPPAAPPPPPPPKQLFCTNCGNSIGCSRDFRQHLDHLAKSSRRLLIGKKTLFSPYFSEQNNLSNRRPLINP